MVEVALHVALVAFQMRFLVSRVLGQRLFLEAHAVAFEIGFGHDVKAVTVAQFIPIRIVRIMAGAHGIDIEFLSCMSWSILSRVTYEPSSGSIS